MSYFVQMAGLAVQNFVSAAAGIAVAIALIRGFARQETEDDRQLLGRPDARRRVYVLLPISLVGALVPRARRASIQNFSPYTQSRRRVEGATQTIAQGPVASQEAIKQLGHQRRRLLQRQLRASVREPDAAHQPACRCS